MSILLTVLFAIFAAVYILPRLRPRQDVHQLPSPSSGFASWIWGHELLVFSHDATEMYTSWARALGPMFRIKAAFFHPDIIVAADHAAVQHIFADTDNYVKSPAFRPPIANLLGKGLVWAEGEDHRIQRQILAPAFSPQSVKNMADDVTECSERLESKLTNYVLANGGGATVNIVEYTSSATLDIIGRVAFGHDFKSIASLSDPKHAASADASAIRTSWANHVSSGITFLGFIAPIIVRTFPSIARAPLPLMQTQGEVKMIVKRLASRLVDGVRDGDGKGKDILSILVRARKEGKEGDRLTDEQILDNISTFIMVGHETTAGVLNFTLLRLAQNPEAQARLRAEVIANGRDLAYDDVQKMPYLDAVVKEGLRLHPASPQTERVALKDDVIPLSKPVRTADGKTMTSLKVSEGQVFHIPFTSMHLNQSVWGPNAANFSPERWINPGGLPAPSELPHGWGGLVTFCDGPRNCIGYRLAIFEFKVILASLVRSLEFHETEAVVQQKISPTLQPVTDGKAGLLPLYVTLASDA